jgi:hypothetical protein
MTGKLPDIFDQNYLRDFNLLIKKVTPGSLNSTADFLILLHSYIAEAERDGVKNLIIAAPHDSLLFKRKIKAWIVQFLLPQMRHIGVKRVAFVMQSENAANKGISHIILQSPEIGVFASMPEAIGWAMGLSGMPETIISRSHCDQNCTI